MKNSGLGRFMSEEQITTLVLAHRYGVMGAKRICALFGLPPELFREWRERYRGYTIVHKVVISALKIENDRVKQRLREHVSTSELRELQEENSCLRDLLKRRGENSAN